MLEFFSYEIVAIGHHSVGDNVDIMNLNAIHVMEKYQKQQLGSGIMEILRQFAISNHKEIHMTMSNCALEDHTFFYVKRCKLMYFLLNWQHVYDGGSYPLILTPNDPSWGGLNENAIYWIVLLIQRFQFYCRFQDKNGNYCCD